MLQESTRSDEKEKLYLDKVFKMKFDDPRLDKVPKRFSRLNRGLKTALEASCAKEAELMEYINRYKLLLAEKNELITARRILNIIYDNLSADSNMMEVVTIKHLAELSWDDYGDKKGQEVLRRLDNEDITIGLPA